MQLMQTNKNNTNGLFYARGKECYKNNRRFPIGTPVFHFEYGIE